MKWRNKGHEFEELGEMYARKKILLYGAGKIGGKVYDNLFYLQSEVTGWIDHAGDRKDGLPVYRFVELSEKLLSENIIILASDVHTSLFARQLTGLGLKENVDFFKWLDWENKYKFIYAFYRKGIVAASFCGVQISNVCNLRCRGCLSFTANIARPSMYGFDYVKENLDAFFLKFDYIDMMELCGGEPFLVPHVEEIYEYAGKMYGDRIGRLSTVTNATVMPGDLLCETLARHHIKVFLDDYRDTVEQTRDTFEVIYEKMQRHGVDVEIRKVEKWINLGIEENEGKTDRAAYLKCIECSNTRLSLINKKLFYCDYECFADMSGTFLASDSDYLNIADTTIAGAEIVEFILGYSGLGYCSMCRYCNGDGKVNSHYIPVAEQIRK